jgi:hypothetical protein
VLVPQQTTDRALNTNLNAMYRIAFRNVGYVMAVMIVVMVVTKILKDASQALKKNAALSNLCAQQKQLSTRTVDVFRYLGDVILTMIVSMVVMKQTVPITSVEEASLVIQVSSAALVVNVFQ